MKLTNDLIGWYIHHRNLLNKGRGEIAWLVDMIKTVALGTAMVAIIFPGSLAGKEALIFIFALAYLGICYSVGWWWEIRRYYQRENDWQNERNPFNQEIKDLITKDGGTK